MQVKSNAAHHRQYERNCQCRYRAVCSREAPYRNDSRQMVETDHRMTQSRQDPFTEGRRRATAHHMMRESRCDPEGRCDKPQTETYQLPFHRFFSQRDHSPLRSA